MHGTPLHRHQLAWLTPAGWARVIEGDWDDEARDCLRHWAARPLPLVVTRQPAGSGPHGAIALGLPAPGRWQRRRLVLSVAPSEVAYFDEFPRAAQLTRLLPAAVRGEWQRLCAALLALGAAARVHGSFGWQQLTGLDHVRAGSDIDVWIAVADAGQADAVVHLLQSFGGRRLRLDGELVFAGGEAIAWREWLAWRAGQAKAVLVKRLDGVALLRQPVVETA
jgi:phosphoribosyl-dephospho-CoA transferase